MVYAVPLTTQKTIRTIEKQESVLHNLENIQLQSSDYFVSTYIERGRNVYARLSSNTSISFFIMQLEEWNYSISENKEFNKVLGKYENTTRVDSYFNAPEDGYYIFHIFNIDNNQVIKLHYFTITSIWSEWVEKLGDIDYDYNILYRGVFTLVIGLTIYLYSILPKKTSEGILMK
jgi:hypothetical protein